MKIIPIPFFQNPSLLKCLWLGNFSNNWVFSTKEKKEPYLFVRNSKLKIIFHLQLVLCFLTIKFQSYWSPLSRLKPTWISPTNKENFCILQYTIWMRDLNLIQYHLTFTKLESLYNLHNDIPMERRKQMQIMYFYI